MVVTEQQDHVESPDTTTVAILGIGAIGEAFAEGMKLSPEAGRYRVLITSRSCEQEGTDCASGLEVVSLAACPEANRSAAAAADLVILAVESDCILPLIHEIVDELRPGTNLMSFTEGISLDVLSSAAPEGVGVFRSMPNLPVKIGKGRTIGVAGPPNASHASRQAVDALLALVGTVIWVEEPKLDTIVALSGFGPACLFYVVEQIQRQYEEAGVPPGTARNMAVDIAQNVSQTLLNTAPGTSSAEQIDSAEASRAVEVLRVGHFADTFQKAIDAALAREFEAGEFSDDTGEQRGRGRRRERLGGSETLGASCLPEIP